MNRVREALHATEIHRAGITGRGITAAVLDTGISRHPDYSERIVAFRDFVNGKPSCYDDASHGRRPCLLKMGLHAVFPLCLAHFQPS